MLPKTLALIDDDHDYAQALTGHLQALGVKVDVFGDSNELLAHRDAFGFGFYVVDLMLPGVDGIALIDILRRRTNASVLVVSGRVASDVFEQAVNAGADMYLSKPVQFEQVVVAVKAVHRRASASDQSQNAWRLDRRAGQLIAPDGARVELSAADVVVMECFLEASGEVVPRDSIRQRLGRPEDPSADGVSGTVFRLRRRIERATPVTVPLQTKSGVGYVFKASLKAI
ncbi:response regulator transcription factor [Piscinibacter gummiphilus]|uniref:Response regulator transcription factor n=1 Tax=Piscinibacter gummiphilus TaxID=946333 RepID=A0ABZ0D0Y9_9BURK|nr:response regulator transcription factor [Piscinibacter gummiphilus]WOB10832.1 response regulator transcription factor [Piscinibacter gummiphilus]